MGATAVTHIQVANHHFLAIANFYTDSKIYRWSGAQFEIFQSIPTLAAQDVETFTNGQFTFVGFANYHNDTNKNHNIDSKFYIWNGYAFENFQSIPTKGAVGIEVFRACGQQYVAIANHYDSVLKSGDIYSVIYKVSGAGLSLYQQVPVISIRCWSSFMSGNDTYLFAGSVGKTSYLFKWIG